MAGRDIGRSLIHQSLRLMADLDAVTEELQSDPDGVAARAFPPGDAGLRSRAIVGARVGLGATAAPEFDEVGFAQQRRLLEAGALALDRIRRDGEDAQLGPDEQLGLEAVMRFAARPAVLFRRGRFLEPPPPWGRLADFRDGIEETARSVGRIQIPG